MNLTQAAGTKIGDVSARLILRGGGNAEVDVEGEVIADNPAVHTNNQCAPGLHGAVWRLNITVAGTPLTVPIYVDAITAGPEATFSSAKIQLCLAGPIGTRRGRAAPLRLLRRERRLHESFEHVESCLEGPVRRTTSVRRPRIRRTTEGQALVPGRVALTMKAKSLKRGRVTITGRLLVNGQAVPGRSDRALRRNEEGCPDEDECAGQLHLQEEDPEEDEVHRADPPARRSRTAVSGATTAGSAGMQDGDGVVLRSERRHG